MSTFAPLRTSALMDAVKTRGIRKAVLITVPSLAALANLFGNLAFLGIFMACGDSRTPCTPSEMQIALSGVSLFPISLFSGGFGYLGYLMNAALWAAAAYLLVRLVIGRSRVA